MKHDCEVILDLLPLYHDGVCSDKSREMVEEHLKECAACQKALEEIRKEITSENVSMRDAGKAWKALTRNLFIRRIAAGALAVALVIGLAYAGVFVYRWDQTRPITMSADELNFGAYRLKDGRVYVEFTGKERVISGSSGRPLNWNEEEARRDYALEMEWSKEWADRPADMWTNWHVYGDTVDDIVLIGAKGEQTVICNTADELPPATEDIERKVAEEDARMARLGKGKGKED